MARVPDADPEGLEPPVVPAHEAVDAGVEREQRPEPEPRAGREVLVELIELQLFDPHIDICLGNVRARIEARDPGDFSLRQLRRERLDVLVGKRGHAFAGMQRLGEFHPRRAGIKRQGKG